VPAAPSATTATNAQTLVNVTWTDNSADETGFKIYRRLSTETEATELATAVTASPYVDSTLTEGQTAYYSVAAYNDNGESAKSKVVNATLDSVKPTVSSHSPTANQQVSENSTELSMAFSESIVIVGGMAISVSSTSCEYNDMFAYAPSPQLVVTEQITNSGKLCAGETITITVDKDAIQDVNGNIMAEDYTFSFTVQ